MTFILIAVPVFFSSWYLYHKTGRYHFLLFPLVYFFISTGFWFFYAANMNGRQGISYFVFGTMPLTFFTFYGIGIAFQDLYFKLRKQNK